MQITEHVNPKVSKATQLRLQAASDRALAEQIAVVRGWREARSSLQQWTQHASTAGPALRALGKRFRATVEGTAKQLDQRAMALTQVSLALDAAERARVPPIRSSALVAGGEDAVSVGSGGAAATSRASTALVCPLEPLARGVAGKEVSALVNALRTYSGELDGTAQEVRALGGRLASELRRELEALSSTEASIDHAVAATRGVLEAPLPGALQGQPRGAPVGSSAQSDQQGGKTGTSIKRMSAAGAQLSGKASAGEISTRPAFDLSLS